MAEATLILKEVQADHRKQQKVNKAVLTQAEQNFGEGWEVAIAEGQLDGMSEEVKKAVRVTSGGGGGEGEGGGAGGGGFLFQGRGSQKCCFSKEEEKLGRERAEVEEKAAGVPEEGSWNRWLLKILMAVLKADTEAAAQRKMEAIAQAAIESPLSDRVRDRAR